jgi:hypothetical protein
VYLTTDRQRLYIGQYLDLQDTAGIPPTVAITAPVSGETVIEGAKLPITVDATDDITVSAVDFLVDGAVVFTDTAAPYQFTFTVPTGVDTLTLSATAVDRGSNVGVSEEVVLNVIPDPLTTVAGVVTDPGGLPVDSASVSTVGDRSGATGLDGSFSIPDVPTILGDIVVRAFAIVDGDELQGRSSPLPPVPAGITDVGNIVLRSFGRIIVAHDEVTLSNTGFSLAPDASQFALNVASWFTGSTAGNFLVFSTNFGLTESQLASTMTSAGHSWTVSTAVDFSLPNLLQYDAIFLAGTPADNQVLIDYVNAGGNVYLAGGTGQGGRQMKRLNGTHF